MDNYLLALPQVKTDTKITGKILGTYTYQPMKHKSILLDGDHFVVTVDTPLSKKRKEQEHISKQEYKIHFPIITVLDKSEQTPIPRVAIQLSVRNDIEFFEDKIDRIYESEFELYSTENILEKIKFTVRKQISPAMFQDCNVKLFLDMICNNIVCDFTAFFAGSNLQDCAQVINYPDGPLEAFKEKYFFDWFPVKYKRIVVQFERKMILPTFNYKLESFPTRIIESKYIYTDRISHYEYKVHICSHKTSKQIVMRCGAKFDLFDTVDYVYSKEAVNMAIDKLERPKLCKKCRKYL